MTTASPMPGPSSNVRPELTRLAETERDRVRTQLERQHATCAACTSRDFTVGDALYLGFLFMNEDLDAYMVALTCRNPDCPAPRTGIKLRKSQFLAADDSKQTR